MNKIVKAEEIGGKLHNDMSVMIGGFLECGVPQKLVGLIHKLGLKDLTLIANDTGFPDKSLGSLVVERKLKKVIASHIGTNPETGKQMNSGDLEVELVPQGTLVERIRCQGAGLGGILTPTGVGTDRAEGKQVIEMDGKSYLLEGTLQADLALIKAWKADKYGNLIYRYAARNFNPVMAMAADLILVEAEEIVDGALDANQVMTPGIFVDYIIDF